MYLPSVITIDDKAKMQISYDGQRRICSLTDVTRWISSFTDSVSTDFSYDSKGCLIQKKRTLSRVYNNGEGIAFSRVSIFNYDYAEDDTIRVSVSVSTDTNDGKGVVLEYNSGKIYTNRDNFIVSEWFDQNQDTLTVDKIRFDENNGLLDYSQYMIHKYGVMYTSYSTVSFADGQSLFRDVNFVNNNNRSQQIIPILLLDNISNIKISIVYDDELHTDVTEVEETGYIQYSYNELGYPVSLVARGLESGKINGLPIYIQYAKFR